MTQSLKPVVLVVEDEEMIRMLAVDTLVDEGFMVLEARHAAEALLVYGAAAHVQVLFTDVNMPGPMNGIGLAEHLKAIAPGLVLMITSARPIAGSIDHLTATFIEKPYELSAVCKTAKDLLAA